MSSSQVVWELQSPTTSAHVRCVVIERDSDAFTVRVLHGAEEIAMFSHGSRADALGRAQTIHSTLHAQGWRMVGRTAPV